MTDDASRLDWGFLLNRLCGDTPGIAHAVAVSADGLLQARSDSLDEENAERLGAYTSGLTSLNNSAARMMDTLPVEQTVVDMAGGRIVVMSIDERAILTVLSAKHAELGRIVYDMAMWIEKVGASLVPGPHRIAG